VSLSARLGWYLAGLHVAAASVAVRALWQQPWWLALAEVGLASSLALGLFLVGRLVRTASFSRDSRQWLADGDFMTRFQRVGQPEIDAQIDLYNRMIDDLRAARVAAQEQQQFLVQVMQASPAGMIVLDFDGRVAAVNPAGLRLIGGDAGDVLGRPLAELGGAVAGQLARLAPGDHRLVSPGDGRRLRVWRGTFLDRGFRRGFFAVEELTDEVRRLERAAHEKLIRLLSHEVNNTVGAAGSLLQSCLTYGEQLRPEDRADFQHALGVVIDRTARLNDFMRGFADVYRLPPPRRHPGDLREAIAAISALVKPTCEARRIRWQVSVPDVPVVANFDRGQIEQALINVAKNALEAVDREGVIQVRLTDGAGRPRLDIVDSGPGLSETARANVFTPFFSTKSDGQGLGLTMVQEVLNSHGFAFALDGPAGGPTTFTVWFTPGDRAPRPHAGADAVGPAPRLETGLDATA
jgi:nitrogen fixation/metabolism regulation signal transduction histidine kinase